MPEAEAVAESEGTIDDIIDNEMSERGIETREECAENPREQKQCHKKTADVKKHGKYAGFQGKNNEKEHETKSPYETRRGVRTSLSSKLAVDEANEGSKTNVYSIRDVVESISYERGLASSDDTESRSREERRTYHASLIIIYCEENQKFYFETKPSWYPYRGHENKIALVGGNMEPGENPEQAARRETWEEVSARAASIILSEMDYHPIYSAFEHIDGDLVKNYVFVSKIPLEKWNILEASSMTPDAGHKTIMTLEEVLESKGRWAFHHYDMIMKFIEQHMHVNTGWKKSQDIDFKESWAMFKSLELPGVYNDSQAVHTSPLLTIGFKPHIYNDSIIPRYTSKGLQLSNSG